MIFTDIKKKHSSHAITEDVSIGETAKAAEFFLSDGIIITGDSTGVQPDIKDLKAVNKMQITKIIGSGITAENLGEYIGQADLFIVGSYFKIDGQWQNEIDEERVKKFMGRFRGF